MTNQKINKYLCFPSKVFVRFSTLIKKVKLSNKKYGLKLLTDEEDRMKKFPQLSKRLETLESQIKEIQRARYDDWK